jgi:hypothetical protein
MGARLNNNPRTTTRGHVNAFPALRISALHKLGGFQQGQLSGLKHVGVFHPALIMVDLRFEHDLKVVVIHGDSLADMQVIRLMHRPAGFNGRRWCFVSETGERAETLFLVDGRFRTRILCNIAEKKLGLPKSY